MPQKKGKKEPKTPDFDTMGVNPHQSYIQKARPLQSLSETDLTLPEFKILDAYLARINSHDPEKRTVRLEKGELEKALGVTRILKDDLNKRLRHLFQVVEVKDESKRKGLKLISLFEEADAEQDDNGLWQISLTCTASAREYIFNIDNIGYLRYRLKNVVNLTSRYSYVLFLYLLDNRFRKTWSIDLIELKALLNCTAESYEAYKEFNDKILKKCHKELNEKTDLHFSYNAIKKGRKVTKIEFSVETLSDELPVIDEPTFFEPEQLSLISEDTEEEKFQNLLSFLSDACDNEFSQAELTEIFSIISTMSLPPHPNGIEFSRFHYLAEVYAKMKVAATKKKISNRYAYFKSIIVNQRNNQNGKE